MNLFPKRLALWVSIPRNDAELARAAVEAGADVIKVHMAVGHRASGNHFGTLAEERERLTAVIQAAAGKPVGLVTGGSPEAAPESLDEVKAMGFSFVDMYARHLPAAWLNGRAPLPVMAAVDSETPLALIGDVAASGVDMLEVSLIPGDGYGQRVTAADIALYRYARRQTELPIIVPSQRRILPADVAAIAATGVNGVMIGSVVTGQEARSVAEATAAFRRAIDQL